MQASGLIKLWVEMGSESQERRLAARLDDPMRRWKVEESDLELYRRRYDFSKARDRIFEYTDTDYAPWHIVHMDDELRGTLNALHHIIAQFPYQAVERARAKLPSRLENHSYDDYASIAARRVVAEKLNSTRKKFFASITAEPTTAHERRPGGAFADAAAATLRLASSSRSTVMAPTIAPSRKNRRR